MKLLHVISSLDPAGGGPVEGIKQLAMVNQQFGHQIEVLTADSPDAPYLKTSPLRVHAAGPGWLKYHYSRRMVPWLREYARNYDVVIVNGLWQYHGFAAWRAIRDSGTPYVVYTHGMLDPWFKTTYPLKHLKKLMYWPWAEYRILRDAGAVLFTSEEERLLARQSFGIYRCNEVVVKYGTAGPDGNPQTELDVFYSKYPRLRGKRLAIFLGRLHEKKGCDLLLQAFARVLAPDADWHLLMCGPDQVGWRPKLMAEAEELEVSERITWINMVSGEMKWGALRASEIFVLPSHQENFGIVVAEALACGVPALISNKVNIWREVQSAGAGIVGTDDLQGACAVLSQWMGMSSEKRTEMRSHARTCFEDRFEIHAAASNLIDVLSKVIDAKNRRTKDQP